MWRLRRLFIARESLKVVVATRSTAGHEDEQPTQECANDAAWSSGDDPPDRRRRRPVGEVAAGFGISERTARKWLSRWRSDGETGLQNHSSEPHASQSATSAFWIGLAPKLRREYRLTGEEIASRFGLPRSTVAGWLTRMGLGRLSALDPKEPARRYQRECPDELLHLDIKRLPRFEGIGHRITGNRRGASEGLGYNFLHVAIDDATRLAYVEVLPDERRWSTTGFLVQVLRLFKKRGVSVERVMTDSGSGHIARLFRKALRMLAIRRIRTRPCTPKTNGKAERFIQTLSGNGPMPSRSRLPLAAAPISRDG